MAQEVQRDGSAAERTETMVAPAAERVGAATVRASALLPGLAALFGGRGAARAAHGGRGVALPQPSGREFRRYHAPLTEADRGFSRPVFSAAATKHAVFWRAGRIRGRRPEASGALLGPRTAVCGHLSAPRLWSRAVGALDQCCPAGVKEGIVVARGELVGECEAEKVDEVLGSTSATYASRCNGMCRKRLAEAGGGCGTAPDTNRQFPSRHFVAPCNLDVQGELTASCRLRVIALGMPNFKAFPLHKLTEER